MAGKNRLEESWDSKISEEKVEAEEARPWRRRMVWVWGDVGGTICGGLADMVVMSVWL